MARLITICILMALTLGVVFQNCSSSVNFGQGRPAAQYSGNGDSYEGKLYTHYGPCGATENAKDSQILIKPGQNFSLLSDNCQPLPSPQPVDAGTVSNLTENSLVIGDRAYYAEGVQPQIIADFTDQVGVALGQTVSSEGRIGNFSGQIAVSARTPVAQVSADGVVFARIVQVTAGQTFYIRANAPANNNETALEIANIGPLNMDWLISTLPAVTSFSTPGTFTWVRPPVGRAFKVDCWGAGGGGGSGGGAGTVGGGGGGGGFSTATFTRVTLNSSETVVVGQGGRGGNIPSASAFANGETGSPSQFGIHLAVGAGLPGIGIGNGGAGGAGGAGLTMAGQTGQSGVGGAAGGPGGAGGGVGAPGQSPGGGGGGSAGAGGGGVLGNGGGPGGVGGNGRCDVTIIP